MPATILIMDDHNLIRQTRPVVILSFHDDTVGRAHATLAGANAYVVKGRMSSKLQPTLTALLSS